jgi:cystathionine beta-lyase
LFDNLVDRSTSDASKWHCYRHGILPFGVADMDFVSPEPVVRALRERAEHGVFGYPMEPTELREVLVERLATRYGWRVAPESLLFIPGCISGLTMALRTVGGSGATLIQPPVYGPFFHVAGAAGLGCVQSPLARGSDGRYSMDLDRFEADITPETRAFVLCNPHNPVGRVYRRAELEAVAEICLRHKLLICSDEIHCELVYAGHPHTPIAALSPEVEACTVTLMAPSKTFNLAGLHCAVAIIPNPELRERFGRSGAWMVPGPNIMGFTAALAAYRDGQPWLDQLLIYLQANRDYLTSYVAAHLPGISLVPSEGTYLAWMDCSAAGIPGKAGGFFYEQAKVLLSGGEGYGGDPHYVRLNYGCPRSMLEQGLERMRAALERLPAR